MQLKRCVHEHQHRAMTELLATHQKIFGPAAKVCLRLSPKMIKC